jgi:hypothetical protein
VLGGVLDRAVADELAVAVIGGEAGIGKTRLSMQAGEQARRQGFTVLVGGCLDIGESTVPSAPLMIHYGALQRGGSLRRSVRCLGRRGT